MSSPLTSSLPCSNPITHRPRPAYTQIHHVVPLAWGGKGSRREALCGSCHDAVHHLLNDYVRNGGKPSWAVRNRYPIYVRQLAQEAWDTATVERRPLTSVAGKLDEKDS